MGSRLLSIILVAVVVLSARAVHGQGTGGTFPDPIASRDLDRLADDLELSPEQRLALDGLHADYLDAFADLRDDTIQAYVDESGNIFRSMMNQPDVREARRNLNEFNGIMQRIRALDDGLFAGLESMLSPDQAEQMPLVRDRRARARYRSGLSRFLVSSNPGARVDLSDYVADLRLTPDERDALEPLVRAYEQQLTGVVRRMNERTQKLFIDLVERMDEALAGMEQDRRRWDVIRGVWIDVGREGLEAASDVSRLNLREYEQLASTLSERPHRQFAYAYYRAAYPKVASSYRAVLPQFDAAVALPGIGGEERVALETARDELRDELDRLARQAIDLQEKIRRSGAGTGWWRQGADAPEQTQLEQLEERREDRNERARDQLVAILGTERAEDVRAATAAANDAEAEAAKRAGSTRPASGWDGGPRRAATPDVTNDLAAERLDPYVPGPITMEELEQYAAWMQLDDEQHAIVQALHVDYADAFDAMSREQVDPLVEAGASLWRLDEETGQVAPPTADRIGEVFAMRRAAIEAVIAVDAAFFDDIVLTLEIASDLDVTEAMQRVRFARSRSRLAPAPVRDDGVRPGGGRMGRFRSTAPPEADLDLARLVDLEAPAAAAEDTTAQRLLAWERDLAPIVEERHELRMQLEESLQQVNAAVTAARARQERSGSIWSQSTYRKLLETVEPRRLELTNTAVEINRTAVEALRSTMSATEAGAVDTAYRHIAHPGVYGDAEAVETALGRALALDDLTMSQRESLGELLASYRGPYRELCEQMVELEERRGGSGSGWQGRRERRNAQERLRFERSELNQRTRRRLIFLLDDAQRQRLGL